MALFSNPAEHAANPPESWQVVKVRDKHWNLVAADGAILHSGATSKRSAEAMKSSGFYFDLWHKERAWYDGEAVPGWRPYHEIKSERDAILKKWAS